MKLYTGAPTVWLGVGGLAQRARWKLWRDQGMDKWVTFMEGSRAVPPTCRWKLW